MKKLPEPTPVQKNIKKLCDADHRKVWIPAFMTKFGIDIWGHISITVEQAESLMQYR